MGIIKVENIKCYAFHGCLVEEAKIGSQYEVNLEVEADLTPSSLSDNLNETVDYVLLNKIVKEEMAIRSKLLETVASRIINRIFLESSLVSRAQIAMSKINPPIGGDVEKVTILLNKTR